MIMMSGNPGDAQLKPSSSAKDQFTGFMDRHKVELLAGSVLIGTGLALICWGTGVGVFADIALSKAASGTVLAVGNTLLLTPSFLRYAALKNHVQTMPQDEFFLDMDQIFTEDVSAVNTPLEDSREDLPESEDILPPLTKSWITPGRIIGALVLAGAAYYYFGRGETSPPHALLTDGSKIIEQGSEILNDVSYDSTPPVRLKDDSNQIIEQGRAVLNDVSYDFNQLNWNHGAVNKNESNYSVGKYQSANLNPQSTCDFGSVIPVAQQINSTINSETSNFMAVSTAAVWAAAILYNLNQLSSNSEAHSHAGTMSIPYGIKFSVMLIVGEAALGAIVGIGGTGVIPAVVACALPKLLKVTDSTVGTIAEIWEAISSHI